MVRFKMLAKDLNSQSDQYRTWVVNDAPDFDGYYYNGIKSGNTPFEHVSAYEILDNNFIADFNLPNPLSFSSTKIELPHSMSNSQLAVIDGYIYLFGGSDGYGNKILRANVNNPEKWTDTGAVLPTNLYGSQAAVIDGYVYLFGGNNGSATDHVYSAPTSNPLNWTDHGSILPKKVYNSQLFILDGYIYLFGGRDDGSVSNAILQCSIFTPLNWTVSVITLPEAIHSSTFGFARNVNGNDGYVCLFGGILGDGTTTNKIYTANTNDLNSWAIKGHLPYSINNNQFVVIGIYCYLLGDLILRCDISNPFSWIDTNFKIPGTISQSQLAIIDDRLFLFGGNGNTTIYSDNSYAKYSVIDPVVIEYGNATRTLFNIFGFDNGFRAIGIAPWRTTYGG